MPSLYGQTLIKSEFDYRREIRRKLDQIQHDNRDSMRRRHANDHVFAQCLLNKRYQWFEIDKNYRDTCRTIWNRQATQSSRTSHVFLPSIYSSTNSSRLTMASINTTSSQTDDDENENSVIIDQKIRQDFLRNQPVMLEILHAPHAKKSFKHKQELELRKKSAQQQQIHIQTNAINDNRYTTLVGTLANT